MLWNRISFTISLKIILFKLLIFLLIYNGFSVIREPLFFMNINIIIQSRVVISMELKIQRTDKIIIQNR